MYRIQSLLWSAIRSSLTTVTGNVATRLNTHANPGTSHMLQYVWMSLMRRTATCNTPCRSAGSTKRNDTSVYLFDFLFVAAGAKDQVCLPLCTFSTLCIHFLFNISGFSVTSTNQIFFLFIPVTGRMKSRVQRKSDQRAGEHDSRGRWTECAVEYGTGCPKSLQVRKCFTMVYSKQLIKNCETIFLVCCFSFKLAVNNQVMDPPGSSIWLRSASPLMPQYFGSLWRAAAKSSVSNMKAGVGPVHPQQVFHPSNHISASIIDTQHFDRASPDAFCLLQIFGKVQLLHYLDSKVCTVCGLRGTPANL